MNHINKVCNIIVLIFILVNPLLAQTTDIITGLAKPAGMVISGNYLYFAQYDEGKISKIDLNESMPNAVDVVTGLIDPVGIALNGNDLYVAELNNQKISKIDISSPTPIATDYLIGLSNPISLLLVGNDLYVGETNGASGSVGKISKVDITDDTPVLTEIIFGLNVPAGLLVKGDELYFSEFNDGTVSKLNVTEDNPSIIQVISGLSSPAGLHIEGNDLYVVEYGGFSKISKIDISSTLPTTSTDVVYISGGPWELKQDGNNYYVSIYGGDRISTFTSSTLSTVSSEKFIDIKIYPNPSSEFLKVSGITDDIHYDIINLLGKKVANGLIRDKENINISKLNNGLYFIKLKIDKKSKILKFIKN